MATLLVLSLPNGLFLAPASAQSGWVGATPVQGGLPTGPGNGGWTDVAIDRSGNAVAVWVQGEELWQGWGYRPSRVYVWANRLVAGSGWGAPVALATEAGNISALDVAIDGLGNAIVVYGYDPDGLFEGAPAVIRANRFSVSTGWEPTSVVGLGPGDAHDAQIAMDSAGNAIVVWDLWNETESKSGIWANRYVVGAGWGVPTLIEQGAVYSAGPQITLDAQGNALAVWTKWDGSQSYVWANHFEPAVGWGNATVIDTLAGAATNNPELAMDPAGTAIAVWTKIGSDSSYSVWANRFAPGTGWGTAALIDPGGFDPEIAMSPAGNAIVAWNRFGGDGFHVWATHYVEGSWKSPVSLGGSVGSSSTHPHVALDSLGNAIVVWSKIFAAGAYGEEFNEPGPPRIWANRYTIGAGWGGEEAVDLGAGGGWDPRVGMDARGNAIVIWSQRHGPSDNIWSNTYVVGMGWGTATLVEGGSGGDLAPQVAAYGQGSAIAVWSQADGTNASIWASVHSDGVGWGRVARIGPSSGDAFAPQVGMDSRGNAMSVWEKWNGVRYAVWSSRSDGGNAWSPATLVDAGSGNAFAPQVAVDPSGNAIAVWQQWDGADLNIWANRYIAGLGWGNATLVEHETGLASHLRIRIDAHGNAIAVWNLADSWNGGGVIWANRYTVGVGWGTAAAIGTATYGTSAPEVAIDAEGDAIVVWSYAWSAGAGVWANRFEPGVGWIGPKQVEADRNFHSLSPQVAMNAQGDAVIVWETYVPLMEYRNISAARYLADSPWGDWEASVQLDFGDESYALSPRVAVDAVGNAVAVWRQWGGAGLDVWANRYVVGLGWRTSGPISWNAGSVSVPQVSTDAEGSAFAVWTQWNETGPSIWSNWYVRSNAPPELSVTTPSASLTNNPVVTVSGSTLPDLIVTIDGVSVRADQDGSFSYTVTLSNGPHTFVVVAQDLEGNTNTKTVSITVDTKAPTLILASPAQGATTNSSTVDIAGTTEPGAQVVVNGLLVAVAPDGSFSFRFGLVEGTNTIVATATDAAGNVATASVTVTYLAPPAQDLEPLVRDLALLKWVAIASSVGLLVVAFVFLTLYWTRRRRGSGGPRESQNGLRLEDPNGASSQVSDLQQEANGGVLLRGLATERRWPAKATSGLIRLTAKERILLHLLHFARYADASEVPPELTQGRIVEAAGIDRRHFAQYAHPLVRDGLVRERTAHVRGAVQRRRVYVLTEEGRARALGVRDRIRSAMVRVRDTSGVREVTVAEALLEARGSMSVLDILRESIETGVVDLTR